MQTQRLWSEKRLRASIENAPNVAVRWCDGNGRVLFWNRTAEKIFGWKSEEAIGKPLDDLILMPAQMEEFRETVDSLGESGGSFGPVENVFQRWDGKTVDCLSTVYAIPGAADNPWFGCMDVDIAERKRAEGLMMNLLRGTSAGSDSDFFRPFLRSLALALECRHAFVAEFGAGTPGSVHTLCVWSDGDWRENFDYELSGGPCEDIAKGEVSFHPSGARKTFPGDPLLADLSAEAYIGAPLFDQSGHPVGLLAAMDAQPMRRDENLLSVFKVFAARAGAELERIGIERRRAALETQLRESQKMEALGVLAGGIAHDFNNILAAIMGNCELLNDSVSEGDEEARVCLEDTIMAAERAQRLVRQILTFSRRDAPRRKVVSLADAIGEAMRLLRATLPVGIELATSVSLDAPNVLADLTQVHQTLVNLCTNAWHAMPHGRGRIEIGLHASDGRDWEGTEASGRYVLLTVSDDGSGMDEGTVENIFDPFFTTKEVGKGTGLGLAVVHGIVRSHDAFLRVRSELGKGSTFSILFPAVSGEEEIDQVPIPEPLVGDGQTIMFLDDESMIVRLGRHILKRLNYQVEGFEKPAEALRAFRDNPGKYHLVVTDYNMPGMTGLEVAGKMLTIRPDVPIILCSGLLDEEARTMAVDIGIRRIVSKPLHVRQMGEAVGGELRTAQVS